MILLPLLNKQLPSLSQSLRSGNSFLLDVFCSAEEPPYSAEEPPYFAEEPPYSAEEPPYFSKEALYSAEEAPERPVFSHDGHTVKKVKT